MCLGIPGEVVEIHREKDLLFGKVRFGGVTRTICLEYVPDAQVGEFVVVHVGFAISKIDAAEASRSYEFLEEMNQLLELTADLEKPS